MRPARPLLVYDGACRVCLASVSALRAWDRAGRIEHLPFQDPSLAARAPHLTPEACARAVQLVLPDGRTFEGAAAIERVLDLLPRGGLLAALMRVPLLDRVADRAYRAFARRRYRFGCGNHCAGPPR